MNKKQLNKVRKMMNAIENKKVRTYGGDFDNELTSVVEGPLFRSPMIPRESQFISSATVNPDGLCHFTFATLKALGIEKHEPEKEVFVKTYIERANTYGYLVLPEHVAKHVKGGEVIC